MIISRGNVFSAQLEIVGMDDDTPFRLVYDAVLQSNVRRRRRSDESA